jgi:hypothetical protein
MIKRNMEVTHIKVVMLQSFTGMRTALLGKLVFSPDRNV